MLNCAAVFIKFLFHVTDKTFHVLPKTVSQVLYFFVQQDDFRKEYVALWKTDYFVTWGTYIFNLWNPYCVINVILLPSICCYSEHYAFRSLWFLITAYYSSTFYPFSHGYPIFSTVNAIKINNLDKRNVTDSQKLSFTHTQMQNC